MIAARGQSAVTEGAAVWGQHALPPDRDMLLRVGPLAIGVRSDPAELWISTPVQSGRAVGFQEGSSSGSEDEWTRWASPDTSEIVVLPALADRPVVVAPEVSFHLTPGAAARIYVRIPVWVRIAFADSADLALTEVPTYVMSDTWWGDFASGELAYWLPTTARRAFDDSLFEPHLVMCPLELINESEEVLPVEKLAVRVHHMPVYRDGEKLWSAETTVRYQAADDGSRIDVGEHPPPEADRAELITAPRERPDRGFSARTFGRFKHLAGW